MISATMFKTAVLSILVSFLLTQCCASAVAAQKTGVAVRTGGGDDQCSIEALQSAAKCKCSLLSRFLPATDYRIQFCQNLFGDDLGSLEPFCTPYYGSATEYRGLAAMFKIEKLSATCHYSSPAYTGRQATWAGRTVTDQAVHVQRQIQSLSNLSEKGRIEIHAWGVHVIIEW